MNVSPQPSVLTNIGIPCRTCGYDLRGTALGSGCPECGTPVWTSYSPVRRQGRYIVARDMSTLPPICVKTGELVDEQGINKTFSWASPWLIVLLLVNILVLLIVYLLVRKKCRLTYFISPGAKARAKRNVSIAVAILIMGPVLMIYGVTTDLPPAIVVGILMMIVGLIAAIVTAQVISVARYDRDEFYFKGFSPRALDAIEEFLDEYHKARAAQAHAQPAPQAHNPQPAGFQGHPMKTAGPGHRSA